MLKTFTSMRRCSKFHLIISKQFSGKPSCKKKVAVVLSGCGMLDGTEIHEAAATAIHLTRMDLEPKFYAPPCPQGDVVDHFKKCPVAECRNSMIEAARIARGNVTPLNELQHCHAEAVIFPGGFGVGKTLSTFATEGVNCTIDAEVIRVMQEFYVAKKPMAFMCISAILPARLFPCVKITLGEKGKPDEWPHASAVDAAIEMGAVVENKKVQDYCFDKDNLIFSTPAFMYEGTFYEIFQGIGLMIENLCKCI